MMRSVLYAGLVLSSAIALAGATQPAAALTMKECSAKYKAAQSAGSLNGMKWNDFRKSQCGSDSAASATTAPAAPKTAAAPKGEAPTIASTTASAPRTGTSAPSSGTPVFPTAVAPMYAKESAGKARVHTCLDQYNANKTTNRNGGLNWIAKGGGYYSECNKRLKG